MFYLIHQYIYLCILELTKAVVLDEISTFRPNWNQSRALDYLYYSGIASAKVFLKSETYKLILRKIDITFKLILKDMYHTIVGSSNDEGNVSSSGRAN